MTGFNLGGFSRVLKMGFQQQELARLYGRSRQSVWAWAKFSRSNGREGAKPVDPVLCHRYNQITDKIIEKGRRSPLPAMDSPQRAAYVNELVAELNTQ